MMQLLISNLKIPLTIVKKYIRMAFLILCLPLVVRAQSAAEAINSMDLNNADNDQYNSQLRIRQMQQELLEKQAHKASSMSMNTVAGGKLQLEQFFQNYNVQLVDKLGSFKLFKVVEGTDLTDALNATAAGERTAPDTSRRKIAVAGIHASPTLTSRYGLSAENDSGFDLKKTNILAQFKDAGIDFLVLTSLEDIDENHLDGAAVSRSYEYVNGQKTGCWVVAGDSYGGTGVLVGGLKTHTSWKLEKVTVSPQLEKGQSLRVILRSRVFDVQKAEMIASENESYTRGRSYTASSRGKNDMSMGDLYQAATDDLVNWERILVEDSVFPIKVLKIDENSALLNRGSDSGIQKNSYYSVWSKGEVIKDPDSGEILGIENKCVGEVLIRELQLKFAQATITKNTGIVVGSVLRLKR